MNHTKETEREKKFKWKSTGKKIEIAPVCLSYRSYHNDILTMSEALLQKSS